MHTLFLNEYRCTCGKLLLKGVFFDGAIEVKCIRCGRINKIGNIKLVENVKHYLLIIDKEGIITNVSSSAQNILSYTKHELIGKHILYIDPTFREIEEKFFGRESTLNEHNYFILDREHQTKDGRSIPVTIFFKVYYPNKDERQIIASVRIKDIYEKKCILNTIPLDNTTDFYFDIDMSGNILCTCHAAEVFLGVSQEGLVGRNYFQFLTPNTILQAKEIFTHFSQLDKSYRTKVQMINSGIDRDLYFTPNYSMAGESTGYRIFGLVGTP